MWNWLRRQKKNDAASPLRDAGRTSGSVAIIYDNEERDRAERVAAPLVTAGHDVVLGPLGLQVGTDIWKQRVRQDLLNAGVVLILLTEKSVMDEWVAWRAKQALQNGSRIIPVQLDNPLPSSSWVIPEQVSFFQRLWFSEEQRDKDLFVGLLDRFLPAPSQHQTKKFDVFLSHNSSDKPAVRKVAEELTTRGMSVWLDEWELIPGRPWQEALEKIIQVTKAAAVLVGTDGVGPWQDREMRGCLSEFVNRDLPVIPVLLPGAPTEPDLPIFLKQFTWVDLRKGLSVDGLDRLQWGITGKKPGYLAKWPNITRWTPTWLAVALRASFELFIVPDGFKRVSANILETAVGRVRVCGSQAAG